MNDSGTRPGVLTVNREPFPAGQRYCEFHDIFCEHFAETDNPMNLDVVQYAVIEKQGRMAFFVARLDGMVVGFSAHWVYMDLHSGEIAGNDDFWHVSPDYRRHGIGKALKDAGHAWQRAQGAKETSHVSKRMKPEQMAKLGYYVWGLRYKKEL